MLMVLLHSTWINKKLIYLSLSIYWAAEPLASITNIIFLHLLYNTNLVSNSGSIDYIRNRFQSFT